MKSLVEASHWRVSSRSPSHNNVVLRSNDAKGLLIFCAMKSANKFFFFFLQFENISAEFRNLTATRSHSQLLDERWCVRRNHFCKLLFWDQTAHPTRQRYWCIVWVREVLRKKKRNFNRFSLTAIYIWKLWHDELSVFPKKTLRFLHSIASMVGGSSNTMMNSLELAANYQTLFWCMSQLWPLRSYSSAPTSNETPFQHMSFL